MNIGKIVGVIPSYRGITRGPVLISTREFGRWMEHNFADTQPEFYLAATHIKNEEGFPKHPGAYLNGFFRKHPVINREIAQRSFHIESDFIINCVRQGIVSLKDANKLVGAEATNYNYIKFYTVPQIELALQPLVKLFNPGFTEFEPFVYAMMINSKDEIVWKYDANMAPPTKKLFDTKKVKTPPPRRFKTPQLSGLCRVEKTKTGLSINLYRVNWDNRNWAYVRSKTYEIRSHISATPPKLIIIISPGSADWHDAAVRKDGSFLLRGFQYNFTDGRYPVEFIESNNTYRIEILLED